MVSIFPSSISFRVLVAGVIAASLFYVLRSNPTSRDLEEAERQIDVELAGVSVADGRRTSACYANHELLLEGQVDEVTTGSFREEAGCEIEVHRILQATMASAHEDLEAGRLDQAQRAAMAVLGHNHSVLAGPSLLGVAISTASAKPALQLLQLLAARSTSEQQRQGWQESVDEALADPHDGDLLTRGIILREAVILRQMRRQGELSGAEQDVYGDQIIGYAKLLVELDSAGDLRSACIHSMGAKHYPAFCQVLAEVVAKQSDIAEQVLQLKEMLAPRIDGENAVEASFF